MSTDTAAVLFTDLVGFTEYTDVCGDAAAVSVLETQRRLVDRALASRDGRVVKELGDGLMLTFSSPRTALDRSTWLAVACRAAVDAGELPLAVRMGLHYGEVTLRGNDLVGHTVNVTSRVAALAGPGELLLSDDVLAAAGARDGTITLRSAASAGPPGVADVDGRTVALEPIGPTVVRGVRSTFWLHRLVVA